MKYFGTDGIRGSYGDFEVSEPFYRNLGAACADALADSGGGFAVAGCDTRASSDSLKAAFCEGFASRGGRVEDMGVLPTPALAYAVLERKAALGAMITASHNPYSDNGIKFFDSRARKACDDFQLDIERRADATACDFGAYSKKSFAPREISAGKFALGEYAAKMCSLFEPGFIGGLTVAVDMANGATSGVSSKVFEAYGAKVVGAASSPDGFNINGGVGSQHPENLAALCRSCGADVGFAHDGDGDRVVVCDDKFSILEGEEVLGLIARERMARGALSSNAIVTTVQSNTGLDESLAADGIKVYRCGIGDRLVMGEMLARGCNVGGENSGHFIFSDISPCGDGLAAALAVLSVMARSGKKLSELRGGISMYPCVSQAVAVARKIPFEDAPNLSAAMKRCEDLLGGRGRILVRYSGTEKKIRLLAESPDPEKAQKCMSFLLGATEIDLK